VALVLKDYMNLPERGCRQLGISAIVTIQAHSITKMEVTGARSRRTEAAHTSHSGLTNAAGVFYIQSNNRKHTSSRGQAVMMLT
jgi:hypothetical protein